MRPFLGGKAAGAFSMFACLFAMLGCRRPGVPVAGPRGEMDFFQEVGLDVAATAAGTATSAHRAISIMGHPSSLRRDRSSGPAHQ
jgi:hypothetical protein